MHRTKLTMVALAAAVAVVFLAGPHAWAQTCGDPDGSGDITETDGINTLRAAADVSSPCQNTTCDTNNDGVIDDVDGVNVLRAAAGLDANLDCQSAQINEVVSEVETGEGSPPAELRVGAAPIPGGGAVDTIGAIEGSSTAVPGSSNTIKVPYDATEQAAAAVAAGADPGELDLKMIIAINDTEMFLQGFFEIPLDELIGEVVLTTFYPQGLEGGAFLFCPATQLDGILSNYGVLQQEPSASQTGPLQVSLSFTPIDLDLDLALVEPNGNRIDFNQPVSNTGGMLDMDSGFPCDSNAFGNENITYPAGSSTPLAGEYAALVSLHPACNPQSNSEYTVVINKNGSKQTVTGSFLASETGSQFTRTIRFNFTPQQ